MIVSFKDKRTASLAAGQSVKGVSGELARRAQRSFNMLNAATSLRDLLSPPGNRLEVLKGNRKGQHSIRLNDHWRFCFVWTEAGPVDVEFVDYH